MATVGQKVDHAILRAALDQEAALDAEIEQVDSLLNNKDDLEELRRKRLEEMKNEHKRKSQMTQVGHGTYEEVMGEKEFFAEAKKSEKVVVHFFRPSAWRCEIVDKHLKALAVKHWGTRFIKINAEKSPYLSEKLHIWMLPSVVLVKGGKTEHTIVGLDELGGEEDFPTEALEEVLLKWGLIEESS